MVKIPNSHVTRVVTSLNYMASNAIALVQLLIYKVIISQIRKDSEVSLHTFFISHRSEIRFYRPDLDYSIYYHTLVCNSKNIRD